MQSITEDSFEKILDSSGCSKFFKQDTANFLKQEREKLQECYYEQHDWRLCSQELERFRQCWSLKNNDHKTIKNNSSN
ncbi:hypothetical protein PMAC_002276 [Pneumocystis sp. 'macacae']|nr:hypothetical protein PMAC_002276 [Pneumocystis sp. 'macacae']